MEFEREFIRVDSALRATALSDTIIHAGACSHMQIASLESLLPGTITESCIGRGFTTEASVENFQKVKEVVGNAIRAAIAKIKELMQRFLDFFRSKNNQSAGDAKAISDGVKSLDTDVKKSMEKAKKESKGGGDHSETNNLKQQLDKAGKTPVDPSLDEYFKLANIKQTSFLNVLIGDNVPYDKVLGILIQYNSPAFRKNIFMLSKSSADLGYVNDIHKGANGLIKFVEALDKQQPEQKAFSENGFGSSFKRDITPFLKTLLKLCGKPDNVQAANAAEYTATAQAAMEYLFKDAKPETHSVFTTSDDLREFIADVAIQKQSILEIIPLLQKALEKADSLKVEGKYEHADQPSKNIYDLAIRNGLTEMRLMLSFMVKLNTAQNQLLLQVKATCDSLRGKLVDFD